jgi:hypothetical protein
MLHEPPLPRPASERSRHVRRLSGCEIDTPLWLVRKAHAQAAERRCDAARHTVAVRKSRADRHWEVRHDHQA